MLGLIFFTQSSAERQSSRDGYQVNSLLVNQSGNGFYSSSHMLDVGFDTRRILSADLDGRPDLLIGRQESSSGFFHDDKSETQPPALLFLKNTLPEASQRNWITVSLGGKTGISPYGAVVSSSDSFMC